MGKFLCLTSIYTGLENEKCKNSITLQFEFLSVKIQYPWEKEIKKLNHITIWIFKSDIKKKTQLNS